jgi:hypothetical protein
MALRPRLSTGLLLSDFVDYIIAVGTSIAPFISVKLAYKNEMFILLAWLQ